MTSAVHGIVVDHEFMVQVGTSPYVLVYAQASADWNEADDVADFRASYRYAVDGATHTARWTGEVRCRKDVAEVRRLVEEALLTVVNGGGGHPQGERPSRVYTRHFVTDEAGEVEAEVSISWHGEHDAEIEAAFRWVDPESRRSRTATWGDEQVIRDVESWLDRALPDAFADRA